MPARIVLPQLEYIASQCETDLLIFLIGAAAAGNGIIGIVLRGEDFA